MICQLRIRKYLERSGLRLFEVLSRHLFGATEDDYGERQHMYTALQPKSELISCPVQLQSLAADRLAPYS